MVSTQLGIAITEITPPFAIPLAGCANRRTDFDGVSKRLYARVWVFLQENEKGEKSKALLVQSDLIWWGAEFTASFSRKLQKLWNLESAHILFHASHTHGGPQTTDRFSVLLGQLRQDYLDFLEHTVGKAIAEAHDGMEPVQMEKGTGSCTGISINRRKFVDGSVVMVPNPDGVNDTEVTVIRFVTQTMRTKGVLFHFTCHPTTTSANRVTSDYCGAAMEMVDKRLGAGVSCFLQGCCGDIRPSLYNEHGFYSGNDDDVERGGEILAKAVMKILEIPMKPLKPILISGWMMGVELPFQRVPSTEELQISLEDTELQSAWKQLMLANPDRLQTSGNLQLQLLQIAEDLAFMAMDGEIVVEYGLLIKNLSEQKVLPLGYSNGMIGYIPTAHQIQEGGYEGKDSLLLFGYPSPFSLQIEQNLQNAIKELLLNIKTSSSIVR